MTAKVKMKIDRSKKLGQSVDKMVLYKTSTLKKCYRYLASFKLYHKDSPSRGCISTSLMHNITALSHQSSLRWSISNLFYSIDTET